MVSKFRRSVDSVKIACLSLFYVILALLRQSGNRRHLKYWLDAIRRAENVQRLQNDRCTHGSGRIFVQKKKKKPPRWKPAMRFSPRSECKKKKNIISIRNKITRWNFQLTVRWNKGGVFHAKRREKSKIRHSTVCDNVIRFFISDEILNQHRFFYNRECMTKNLQTYLRNLWARYYISS